MNFDVLHNFISPVTGRIVVDFLDYTVMGNYNGVGNPSPILIDIELDLMKLRTDYNTLRKATFIMRLPNDQAPNAQALIELLDSTGDTGDDGPPQANIAKIIDDGYVAIAIPGQDYVTVPHFDEITDRLQEAVDTINDNDTINDTILPTLADHETRITEIEVILGLAGGVAARSLPELDTAFTVLEGRVTLIGNFIPVITDFMEDSAATVTGIILDIGHLNIETADLRYRFDNLRLNNISADGDVSLYNYRMTSLGYPINPTDAATKGYADSITGGVGITLTGAVTGGGLLSAPIFTTLTDITVSQITDFDTAVRAYRLDQFRAPNTTLSMGGQKISLLNNPSSSGDAANKGYVDNKTWTASQITNFNTATQSLINATPISSLAAAAADINLGTFSISSSTAPTAGDHLGNKTYIDNTSSSAATTAVNNRTTTLTGAVTGTATGNTINTVLTNITPSQVTGFDAQVRTSGLDQMAVPTANMDFNGKLLNNVATPLSTNTSAAATVGYVTSAIAAGGATTTKPYGGLKIVNGSFAVPMTSTPSAYSPPAPMTLVSNVYNFDSPSNGVLRCLSPTTYTYLITAPIQVSTSTSSSALTITLQIVKNGVLNSVTPTFACVTRGVTIPETIMIVPEPIDLALNDYLQIYAATSASASIVIKNMTLIASVIT